MIVVIFQIKNSAKYKYKLAIRHAVLEFENRCDDDLSNLFLHKKMPEFWKVWSSKFRRSSTSDVFINGSNDPSHVANVFADHFSKVYVVNADMEDNPQTSVDDDNDYDESSISAMSEY